MIIIISYLCGVVFRLAVFFVRRDHEGRSHSGRAHTWRGCKVSQNDIMSNPIHNEAHLFPFSPHPSPHHHILLAMFFCLSLLYMYMYICIMLEREVSSPTPFNRQSSDSGLQQFALNSVGRPQTKPFTLRHNINRIRYILVNHSYTLEHLAVGKVAICCTLLLV